MADVALRPGSYAYSSWLISHWHDPDDWAIVEHDVEVSLALLDSLRDCAEPLCSGLYVIRERDVDFLSELWRSGERWSIATILGATKITARARHRADPPAPRPGQVLVGVVTSGLAQQNHCRWHLHPEHVVHHHEPRRV